MTCAMRPEFERGAGTGQWHGGPIAAIIDTVGDYALIMALRRGLPTINFRVDYLRPAIKTALTTTAHGAPRRQERRRGRCRRVQRPEGAGRGRPRDLFDAGGLSDRSAKYEDCFEVRRTEGLMGKFRTSRLRRGRAGLRPDRQGATVVRPGRAQARRHAGGDLGRRRAAGLLRAGRRRIEPDLLLVQSCSSGWAMRDGWTACFDGDAGRELEARRRLQVLHDQAAQGREVPRRQGHDRRRRRLFDRRDLEEIRRRLGADRLRRRRGDGCRHRGRASSTSRCRSSSSPRCSAAA